MRFGDSARAGEHDRYDQPLSRSASVFSKHSAIVGDMVSSDHGRCLILIDQINASSGAGCIKRGDPARDRRVSPYSNFWAGAFLSVATVRLDLSEGGHCEGADGIGLVLLFAPARPSDEASLTSLSPNAR
jgi:hypothetical protein